MHDGTTPPMNLTQLLDEAPPPAAVRDADVSPDATAVAQRRAEAAARFRGLVARWAPDA
ncbi:hypothetical protein [Cellulomonas xiejunii]|uniref:hypothetical protein n=1 Tax=Cellulomonas xiejunii TaxID=2968083 RepID=UPI002104A293|nr:hypothetical protein [Cellulomonas xiejunii]